MRRLTAVFSKRDKERDASAHGHGKIMPASAAEPSTLKKSASRKALGLNVDTAPLPSSDPSSAILSLRAINSSGPQSSSSSSGSASLILQTPDEEPIHMLHTPSSKSSRSWIPWRSGTIKASQHPGHSSEHWSPSNASTATPKSRRLPTEESESETSEDEEDADDEDGAAASATTRLELTPTAIMHAKRTAELLLQNSLRHRITPCPFMSMEPCPPFPRSINSTRLLPRQETLQSSMHKKRLLRCLQEDKPLTISEQTSLLPLSLRRIPATILPQDPFFDDVAPPKSSRITGSSVGVRRWLTRPCFEDRHYVWLRVGDGVDCCVVSGSRLAVPELEYSTALEAMAAPVPEATPLGDVGTPETHLSIASSVSSHSSDVSAASRRSSMPPPPSSLRKTTESPSPSSSPVGGAARREVRFAEEDKDDNIPIGYSMRAKKQREDKARFLREQEEIRKQQEERYKFELERQQREKERLEWEKERQAWEKEKRAIEEERKKKLYQQEVLATRNRRETQRAGHPRKSETWAAPVPVTRHSENRKQVRPSYDQRREQSESVIAKSSKEISHSSHPVNMVKISSRDPSSSDSRPASLHSNASDFRQDMPTARSSVTSFSSLNKAPAALPMPVWPQHFLYNPMGFPMTPYGMEVPLLPPNAPFMGYSTSRSQSRHSSSHSPSPTRSQAPSNASSDQLQQRRDGPTPSSSFPNTPSSMQRPNLKDVRRSSMPAVPRQSGSYNSSSQGHSRGRAPVPAVPSPSKYHSQVRAQQQKQEQAQSPWTALPSQSGIMPTSMATTRQSGYDSLRSSTGRRNINIS